MARIEKIDVEEVTACIKSKIKSKGRRKVTAEMKQLQLAAYVMCNGGFIGRMAAEQPEGFYIDARVSKRPYHYRHIYNVVAVLNVYRNCLGLNEMPKLEFDAHNSGVW